MTKDRGTSRSATGLASSRIRLEAAGGLDADAVLGSLAAHTVPGAEVTHVANRTHSRLISGPLGARRLTLRFDEGGIDLELQTQGTTSNADDPGALLALTDLVRAWFDLDSDLGPIRDALGTDPLLAPLVAERPNLRVIGTPDCFQSAVTTVLGQQVSLSAGRTFAGRLVEAYGEPTGSGLSRFPRASALAGADPDELRSAIGLTSARARTVLALARAWLEASPLPGAAPSRSELLAVPGIGPWTVDYLAVRFGDRDAFTPSDLVLRRALGGITSDAAARRAEAWSPFRAYALMHLWTHAAYGSRSAARS